ncbi:D-alanyl-D-alanine carboxypeptidase [Caproiciproducens sp. NJN-50]|nr:D-alanyl-D-alanine carboxypeptidase family protein [Caproiciproducens sp. NJN-50]QAT49411.1 D-alanyl-D-alanine carboxypeptidase [Caproiciproducens sp. NJN-50]
MLKKAISILLAALAAALFPCAARAQGTAPSVSARSAVVIGAADGRVLYEKNSHEKLPIASTTKIMTALLTLEAAARGDETVLITPEMVRVEGSSMGLKAGDKLTLTALAEGMLSVSGNDAANSAAIAVGGSIQKFAALMNQKAAQLGLSDTHYVTPSGLDDEEHYSSAGDLAKLTAAALEDPEFARIVAQPKIKVRFSDPDRTVTYTNHNKLLSMYDGCTGVKTGFTKKSGRCLVSAAERNGVQLVAVTLSDPNDWEDHERLLDYGFSRLTRYQADDSGFHLSLPVVGGAERSVLVAGSAGTAALLPADEVKDLRRTVELPQFVYAPVTKGQVLGLVRYSNSDGTAATTKLTAGAAVPRQADHRNMIKKLWDRIRQLLSV